MPSDALIGRIVWAQGGDGSGVTVRTRRRSAVMTAADTRSTLTIHLLVADPARVPPRAHDAPATSAAEVTLPCYTPAQVAAFVEAVGDHNPIHRTAHPVVPGCLLLADLAARISAARYDLRLRAPVCAGEAIRLLRSGERIEGYTDQAHVLTLMIS